jgi:PPM family protein phosphatase
VLSALSPREATEFLIDKARSRSRGTGDNLSLVVVKLEPLGAEAPAPIVIPPMSSLR